jgi:hypothetical protein
MKLARTICVQCIHGNFGRETTIYTALCGVYVRFWHPLNIHLWYHHSMHLLSQP